MPTLDSERSRMGLLYDEPRLGPIRVRKDFHQVLTPAVRRYAIHLAEVAVDAVILIRVYTLDIRHLLDFFRMVGACASELYMVCAGCPQYYMLRSA